MFVFVSLMLQVPINYTISILLRTGVYELQHKQTYKQTNKQTTDTQRLTQSISAGKSGLIKFCASRN